MDAPAPVPGDTLVVAALKILHQPDAVLKAQWTEAAAQLWAAGYISVTRSGAEAPPPGTPARSDKASVAVRR